MQLAIDPAYSVLLTRADEAVAFFFPVHVNHTGNRQFAAQRPARWSILDGVAAFCPQPSETFHHRIELLSCVTLPFSDLADDAERET